MQQTEQLQKISVSGTFLFQTITLMISDPNTAFLFNFDIKFIYLFLLCSGQIHCSIAG